MIEVPDNKYFPDGMEINDVYRVNINMVNCYVYQGTCDNIPTKWITKTEWDFKINIVREDEGIYYRDTKGDLILVLEEDDDLWGDIVKNT